MKSLIIKLKNNIKQNYQFLFSILLLVIILIIAINPEPYISATFKGLTVWAEIVLPSLFCFFILTKLLMNAKNTPKIFNFLNKPFEKIYNTPKVGGYIFAMSAISGYPLGAKLISEFYKDGTISSAQAHRLTAYCSTSGPMFILGSLASSLFNNFRLGIVILISHFLASILNGFIYKNYGKNLKETEPKQNLNLQENIKKESLNDILFNSITSVLMVGGYIALCFTVLEIFINTNILSPIINGLNFILPPNSKFAESIIKGITEVTNGCVSLANKNYSLKSVAMALTTLLSFGGFSIHLQSQMFLSLCKIKYKYFFLTKVTHSIIALVLSGIFSIILL